VPVPKVLLCSDPTAPQEIDKKRFCKPRSGVSVFPPEKSFPRRFNLRIEPIILTELENLFPDIMTLGPKGSGELPVSVRLNSS
jgi:hypothetical protein